jgi:branched-chain amino acid transport system ATP-binding protein
LHGFERIIDIMLFRMSDVNVYYDKVHVLVDISLEMKARSVIALIGANGAGKTTMLRTISGLKRAATGSIVFEDEPIDKLAVDVIVKRGIIHVAEGGNLFPYITVLDNLKIGAYLQNGKEITQNLKRIYEKFPILKQRSGQLAATLSGGEKQMLAMGRAMMANPKLLMLDEPTLGLSPIMSREISKIVTEINADGISIILVEQNARMALALAQQGYVLETGRIVMADIAANLLNNQHVRSAYLGG